MIRAILTDIEGTTSSLSFVKDVLFPYAAKYLPDYVRRHANEEKVRAELDAVRNQAGATLDDEGAIKILLDWIAQDKKNTPLKTLQGYVWEDGYRKGAFQGHIYEDAARVLRAWRERGLDLYVYSSGSVWAQKLLFAHTPYGDLTPLFSGYFDTHIGGKRERESYQRIAQAIGLPTNTVLFLSDIKEELDAASSAGMQVRWLWRDSEPPPDPAHASARDFRAITLE